MKKVFIVFPRFIVRNLGTPLGPLYLCSVLKKAGFEVSFIDGTVSEMQEVKEKILKEKPQVLLVSMHTVFADFGFELAEFFKKESPKGITVFGGPHVAIMPEQVLQNPAVDFVCPGEGENAIVELLKNPINAEKISGIGFKKKGKVFFTKPRLPIQDLDSLPFPARDLLDKKYYSNGSTSIITSRGCPFNCAFCQPTLRRIFGEKFRMRSPENVIEEIKEIQKVFKKKGFELKDLHFTDDGLTYNKAWLEKLGKLMIEERLNIEWSANTRADTMPSVELLQLLREAGLQSFSIGVESGDPFIRNEILRKGLSQEKLVSAFKTAKEAGVKTEAYLMVGSPEESEKSINATVHLLDEISPDSAQVTITSPLPGTFLADFVEKEKLSDVKKWSDFAYGEQSHLKLKNFSKEKIKRVQMAMLYAIRAHDFFKRKFKKEVKYSVLYRIFRQSPVNSFMRALQFARFRLKKLLR